MLLKLNCYIFVKNVALDKVVECLLGEKFCSKALYPHIWVKVSWF